jgi:hypothetical protein
MGNVFGCTPPLPPPDAKALVKLRDKFPKLAELEGWKWFNEVSTPVRANAAKT